MDTRLAQPAARTAGGSAAAAAAVAAVGACSAIVRANKVAEEAGWLGPPPGCCQVSLPPPGAQRYIIYKVLKFGVSWGGHHCLPLGSFFIFRKITLGTAVLAAGGICPSPCTTPAAAWAGGRGGTVPVIIKHEFN